MSWASIMRSANGVVNSCLISERVQSLRGLPNSDVAGSSSAGRSVARDRVFAIVRLAFCSQCRSRSARSFMQKTLVSQRVARSVPSFSGSASERIRKRQTTASPADAGANPWQSALIECGVFGGESSTVTTVSEASDELSVERLGSVCFRFDLNWRRMMKQTLRRQSLCSNGKQFSASSLSKARD